MRRNTWAAAAAALLAGCGGYTDGRVPAVGRVTLDGAPLANAYVTFRPDDGQPGQGGFATTDAAGNFEIAYPDTGKGLVPARYKVTVLPGRPAAGPDAPPFDPARAAKAAGIPPVYGSPEQTPLRARVEPGGSPCLIELTSTLAKK